MGGLATLLNPTLLIRRQLNPLFSFHVSDMVVGYVRIRVCLPGYVCL